MCPGTGARADRAVWLRGWGSGAGIRSGSRTCCRRSPAPRHPQSAASGNCSGAGRARPLPASLAHSLCDLENQRTWKEVIALGPQQNLLWDWGFGGPRPAWRLAQAHSPTCLPYPQVSSGASHGTCPGPHPQSGSRLYLALVTQKKQKS